MVATLFEVVDADIIVMIDGDGTHDATRGPPAARPTSSAGDADTWWWRASGQYTDKSFRKFHVAGNQMVCGIINKIFGSSITDIFSGYRAFTRDCALNIPITSRGFADVEDRADGAEPVSRHGDQGDRGADIAKPGPVGSFSKLRTCPTASRRVLLRLFLLLRAYKPLSLFGTLFIILFLVSVGTGILPFTELILHRYVASRASAIVSIASGMLAFMSLSLGLVLSSVNQRFLELERVRSAHQRQGPVPLLAAGFPGARYQEDFNALDLFICRWRRALSGRSLIRRART